MELKFVIISRRWSIWRRFELNLYGIEMQWIAACCDRKAEFELNLYGIEIVVDVMNVSNILLFELNLYGIEIEYRLQMQTC